MARLHRSGERDSEELVPDFDWVRRVTIVIDYDAETDTVVIDRGPLGPLMVEAILTRALEDPAFTDDEVIPEEAEDE